MLSNNIHEGKYATTAEHWQKLHSTQTFQLKVSINEHCGNGQYLEAANSHHTNDVQCYAVCLTMCQHFCTQHATCDDQISLLSLNLNRLPTASLSPNNPTAQCFNVNDKTFVVENNPSKNNEITTSFQHMKLLPLNTSIQSMLSLKDGIIKGQPYAVDQRGWLHAKMTVNDLWFTIPQMITHPSTNRGRSRTTMSIKINTLPLIKIATCHECTTLYEATSLHSREINSELHF